VDPDRVVPASGARPTTVALPDHPLLSVVVPAHNATAVLERCLGALRASHFPWDAWELLVVDDASGTGLPAAAGATWVLQLVAFAGLVAVRDRPELFMLGFAGGMVLRVGMVVGAALWLRATGVFPALPTMIGFVVFLFVMMLLEAVFLRKGEPGG